MMKYVYAGIAVLIAVMAFIILWLYGDVQDLQADLATEKANVQIAKTEINGLNENILMLEKLRERDQQMIDSMSDQFAYLQEQNDETIATLNSYRSRLNDFAIAKPGLVGRRASAATQRLFNDFRTATGRAQDGGGEDVPPSEAESGTPAEGH